MKKLFIFLLLALFFIVMIPIAIIHFKTPSHTQLFEALPSPTPIPLSSANVTSDPLHVVSIAPQNTADQVPTNQPIIVTFTTIAKDMLDFSVFPETEFTYSLQGKTMKITPTTTWDNNTVYSYTLLDVSTETVLYSGSFTTGKSKDAIKPLVDTETDLSQTADAAQRKDYPDVFLANYVPYDAKTFSVAIDDTNQTSDHFSFVITSNSPSGKQDFLSWLSSLQLTTSDIQKLDLHYN